MADADGAPAAGAVVQVVDAEGDFNAAGVAAFLRGAGVEAAGRSYAVVAITGPQSSGKSTLLNRLFGTSFAEMDALAGRRQTTRGVWLAPAPAVAAPPTLVLDLEGSDGRERGEDDTSFERQSALFALAQADALLVNMWAKDVGREAGAGKPLLKTIFQVHLKLFAPGRGAGGGAGGRRTALLFVFRDRTRTPLERLRETWEADLAALWAGLKKPPGAEGSAVADFFDVRYAALSNYEERPEAFEEEVAALRARFAFRTADSSAAEDGGDAAGEDAGPLLPAPAPDRLPGAALALSMGQLWDLVRSNKDLDLPAHRVMVANIRCAELAAEALERFGADAAWAALAAAAAAGPVAAFGASAGAAAAAALNEYDAEARYFDAGTAAARRATLSDALAAAVRPAHGAQLAAARARAVARFEERVAGAPPGVAFVDAVASAATAAVVDYDAAAMEAEPPGVEVGGGAESRAALEAALEARAAALRAARAAAALAAAAAEAERRVGAGAAPLLEAPPADLWPRLRGVFRREGAAAAGRLSEAVSGLGLEAADAEALAEALAAAARGRLLACAREAANTALPRLKERFSDAFLKDDAGLPRSWTPAVDVAAAAAGARRAAAALLAQLSVVRLDEGAAAAAAAAAVDVAVASLAEERPRGAVAAAVEDSGADTAPEAPAAAAGGFDLLSATEWPGVAPADALLAPPAVRAAWRQLLSDSALAVQQAAATQEANRLAQNRAPPLWAVAAILFLGFNEFVAVLRNPLLLVFVVLSLAFLKTVYEELGVEAELRRGLLPGALSLSAKFVPTIKAVTSRTVESARAFLAEQPAAAAAALETPPGGGAARSPRGRENGVPVPVSRPAGAAGLRARPGRAEVELLRPGSGAGEAEGMEWSPLPATRGKDE
jgi:hypothetical protein